MGLGLIAAEVRQNDGADRQVRSLPRVVTEATQPKPAESVRPRPVQEAAPASPSEPVVSATEDGSSGTGPVTAGVPATDGSGQGAEILSTTTETVTFETVEVLAELTGPADAAPPLPPPVNYVPPAPLSLVPPAGAPTLPRPGSDFNALPDGSPIVPGPSIRPPGDLDLDLEEPSEPSDPTFSGPTFSDP
ncbi:MAG: hypothetical protein ABR540_02730 [Acidimicrobiales bacterium]